VIYGIGIGFAMHSAPAYLGEVMPPTIRGAVVSGKEVAIVLGMLLGYLVGYSFLNVYRGWSHTYAVSLVFSSVMVALSYYIPYSPRWLVSRGRDGEALKALMFVWKPEQAKIEHFSMIEARKIRAREMKRKTSAIPDNHIEVLSNEDYAASGGLETLFSVPSYRAALTAGVGLVVLQQITGQPSVLSYATPILISAGLSSYSSVLVAFFKVVATTLAVVLVERSGRRKLLMAGCALMCLALMILTVAFQGHEGGATSMKSSSSSRSSDHNGLDTRSAFILVGMFVYIAGYQVGFGPITWLIISEVFPQSIRGQAVALAVQTNFALNAVVQFGVPLLEQQFGLSFMFGMFGLLTAYSIYFISTRVPETRGLTLEEIEEKFSAMSAGHGKNASWMRIERVGSEEEKIQLIPTASVYGGEI